ncbi:MAG: type II secretion system F family protein [Candidatus Micrarchaeota archaeon]|nr:type II secretion system F family protein [Candidatus Micrarchaeota archaeon]
MARQTISFERYLPRPFILWLSNELDLAGMKVNIETLVERALMGVVAILLVVPLLLSLKFFLNPILAVIVGIALAALLVGVIYMFIEYEIERRKSALETILPEYYQIASANLRSGIALDRAMLLAARPEFKFFSEDIKEMSRRVFSGETFESSMHQLTKKYRSYQFNHSVRMMLEAVRYGGAMADLLEQISKDLRNQQLIQKEVAGQLFMYSIFIAFAGLIASPLLYGLTNQMITITDTVWQGIKAANGGAGLPSTGISFLKPNPPPAGFAQTYSSFSIVAIIIITGFASLIMSAISSGSAVKGLRWLPIFIVVGLVIFVVVGDIVSLMLSGIGGSTGAASI